jgi:hypothetical protein
VGVEMSGDEIFKYPIVDVDIVAVLILHASMVEANERIPMKDVCTPLAEYMYDTSGLSKFYQVMATVFETRSMRDGFKFLFLSVQNHAQNTQAHSAISSALNHGFNRKICC